MEEKNRQKVHVLQEYEQEKLQKKTPAKGDGLQAECALPFFLLAGIFLSVRQLAYSMLCVEIALAAGALTMLVRFFLIRKMQKPERIKNIFYIEVVVSFAILAQAVMHGLLDLTNRILILWNQRFGTEFNRFQISSRAGIGALWLWCVSAILLALFLTHQIEKQAFAGILFFVILAMLVNFGFENHSLMSASFFLVIGTIGLLITYTTRGRRERKSSYVVLLCFCLLVAGIGILNRDYKKINSLEDWKEDVVDGTNEFRYGSDSLPQGEFQKASGLLDGDEKRLQLQMKDPESLYLRGYVGSQYAYTKWNTLDQKNYQNKNLGMLRWLEKKSFVPVNQYTRYDLITGRGTGMASESEDVTVKNTGAYRKYLYLPNTAKLAGNYGDKVAKDWQVQSKSFFGTSDYSFQMIKNAPMAEEATAAEWLEDGTKKEQKQYRNAEAVYHSFVEENYLQVPDDVKSHVKNIFFKKGTGDTFEETTKKIRQVLRDEVTYKEAPENVPQKRDLATWFLEDSKEGNAVSYATAAVLAYRTAGYPARYVEGYHLSEKEADDWKKAKKKDAHKVEVLTTKNAHAWTEVYIAGMGWLPVEVVPGMYVETYTNQYVAGQPAYEVNSGKNNNGMSTENNGAKKRSGQGEQKKDDNRKPVIHANQVIAVIEGVLYLIFALYLLLELQRFIRLRRQNRRMKHLTTEQLLDFYVLKTEEIFRERKIQGDYTHPDELWEQVDAKLPDFDKEEYDRVVQLVQKVRFGCMNLMAYERLSLYKYYQHLTNLWYNNSSGWKKLVLRYRYLVQTDIQV